MKRIVLFGLWLVCLCAVNAQEYNYLGEYTSDGTPKYFVEKDVVSQETLDKIAEALPERYPVPEYNPQYITSGYDTDIILEKDADVWVTFVGEGAGYKNVLGFYTYDTANPPQEAPQPEEITIVFPNVSAKYSGGSLEVGHKVKIGHFDAGTGIGWVLLANGWKGSVTPGLWQLFSNIDFNPEKEESLRHHNVLLTDPDTKCIILGFEDIRRDYGSCDNDFNDALFYITANPFEAIKTTNYSTITEHSSVSSGNDGGLESNGDLARLIAKRNFDRNKSNTFNNKLNLQSKYTRPLYSSNVSAAASLDSYFPTTGMFGTETPYVSSPEDLLAITNAEQVFAIDYYKNGSRVSAALGTQTKGEVYNHTKTICDRLNSSQLKDVRQVTLQGHQLVYSELVRQNGNIEYALVFSVKEEESTRTLYSRWNLNEYPAGDYLNFQIWGNSMGQVSAIANAVLTNLKLEKELQINRAENVLPTVFIRNGYYQNGKLHLKLINKNKARWLLLDANYKTTEQQELQNLNQVIDLSGAWEEEISIATGHLFDMGLSILAENSYQFDAMYVADGPWGVDLNETVDSVTEFVIQPHTTSESLERHSIERGVVAKGEVKETINIFRNILAGDLQLAVDEYQYLHLTSKNSRPIELSLVTNVTDNWDERLRLTIPANEEETEYAIPFTAFTNHLGAQQPFTQLRTIVFSIQGDYKNYTPFEFEVKELALTETGMAQTPNEEEGLTIELQDDVITEYIDSKEAYIQLVNYPNPFTSYTLIGLPEASPKVSVTITTLSGQILYQEEVNTLQGGSQVRLELSHLPSGFYAYRLVAHNSAKSYSGKLIKK